MALSQILAIRGFNHHKSKKLTLKIQDCSVQTYQILTNDDQIIIFCLSYFITTVTNIKQTKDKQTTINTISYLRKNFKFVAQDRKSIRGHPIFWSLKSIKYSIFEHKPKPFPFGSVFLFFPQIAAHLSAFASTSASGAARAGRLFQSLICVILPSVVTFCSR